MCVIIFLENHNEAPLWPNSHRVQDVPGSALRQEFQLECLERACERPEFAVFVSCAVKGTKGHSFAFETDKNDVASRVLLCPYPPLAIRGAES